MDSCTPPSLSLASWCARAAAWTRSPSKPLLKNGSVLHTDSAKAYQKVGPLEWPASGALHRGFESHMRFATHGWTHTNVTHKRKVGQPIRYVVKSEVALPDGRQLLVLKGTQKIDGDWASLRRLVGKLSVETGHSSDADRRAWLHGLVRVHQWRWWHLGQERFELLGKLFAAKRASLSF